MREDVKEKILRLPPGETLDMVTCIQPCVSPGGALGFAALDRRVFQRRNQPQLLVPTQRFHEAVALDAVRHSMPRKRSVG